MKNKITKDILLLDLLVKYPESASILIEKYDLHCIGCVMAAQESLEQGLQAHGYDEKKIKEIIIELNQANSSK